MIAGICMVKDEADVIDWVLRHLLREGVDLLLVADNGSTDGTVELIERLAYDSGQVALLHDEDPAYYQSVKMSRLAAEAMDRGADWVLPFDADEVFYVPGGRTIADALSSTPHDVVLAYGFDHVATQCDPPAPSPLHRMVYRRDHQQKFPKVAFRAHEGTTLHMGNHNVDHPGLRGNGPLGYRHFQWRSLEQMTRKVRNGKAAYDATTLHQGHGAHWRQLGALTDEELAAEWQALSASADLVCDPVPLHT